MFRQRCEENMIRRIACRQHIYEQHCFRTVACKLRAAGKTLPATNRRMARNVQRVGSTEGALTSFKSVNPERHPSAHGFIALTNEDFAETLSLIRSADDLSAETLTY